MVVTIELSGAVDNTSELSTDLPTSDGMFFVESCDDYVQGGTGAFPLPLIYGSPELGDLPPGLEQFQFLTFINAYSGPGAYSGEQLDIGLSVEGATYYEDSGATVPSVATVDADGSGDFTFDELPSSSDPASTISGRIAWVCEG